MTSDQLKLLVKTVQQLSLARDLDTIVEIVRASARKLTGANGATFILKDQDKCYYVDEDAIGPLWKGQRFPMVSCISGWAMIHKQFAAIEDIYADSRIPADAYRPTFVKSLVMVPIRTIDPIGAIGNYWAERHTPTVEEIELLQSLADITSVSIENVYVYNELEERVKQRTEQLELANKELESFSYSVSHDLRAPLRVINGYAHYLASDYSNQLDDEGKQIINSITSNTLKMGTLIEDLLTFSRMSKQDINKTVINMNELVSEVVADYNQSTSHLVKINYQNLHNLFADRNLLYQVMFNLISNAVKYSSKKENALVEIVSIEENDEIIFSVKDNGAGFDMKYASKLFGVFQRLHSREEFEGTGVGLALVERIISRHGGKIWAEGIENEGATFSFSLKSN